MKINASFSIIIVVLLLIAFLAPMLVDSCGSTTVNNSSKIKGLKFNDLNRDGKYQSNEPGVAGVTIQLINATNSSVIAQTTTNTRGYYEFKNLLEGSYIVNEILLIGVVNTTPSIVPVTLGTKQVVSVCFGNAPLVAPSPSPSPSPSPCPSAPPACSPSPSVSPTPTPSPTGLIKGIKFYDTNRSGRYDPSEPRIAGVTIQLLSGGNVIAQAVTNSNGYYQFANLTSGAYVVREVVPAGYVNTTPISVAVTLNGRTAEVPFGNVFDD